MLWQGLSFLALVTTLNVIAAPSCSENAILSPDGIRQDYEALKSLQKRQITVLWDRPTYEYYFATRDWKNWEEARKFCNATGGVLATIHSKYEDLYIRKNCGDDCWIGAQWHTDDTVFYWIDNSTMSYTGWGPDEPLRNSGTFDCVKIDKYDGWTTATCTKPYPFVCKRYA
ncbi:hypothetical protein L596_022722 [Steinernema carpocapsae]|uniref:C-type lectin domain-containing protein n=1 Tax=Steinernema carpocapsae TaxID=34508 RepID=A0A4U5MMJ1_STECR|nr:hypothetical protein L596_022722 [Steinernema carpocapsae]